MGNPLGGRSLGEAKEILGADASPRNAARTEPARPADRTAARNPATVTGHRRSRADITRHGTLAGTDIAGRLALASFSACGLWSRAPGNLRPAMPVDLAEVGSQPENGRCGGHDVDRFHMRFRLAGLPTRAPEKDGNAAIIVPRATMGGDEAGMGFRDRHDVRLQHDKDVA